MRRREFLAGFGAAVSLVAGCSAAEDARPTPTVTPLDVEAESVTYPRGLNASGPTAELVAGHLGSLSGRRFRVRRERRNRTESVLESRRTARVDAPAGLARETWAVPGIEMYDTDAGRHWRQETAAGATYGDHAGRYATEAVAGAAPLRAVLAAVDWRPPRTQSDGAAFRADAATFGTTAPLRAAETFRVGPDDELRLTGADLRVTEGGVVRRLEATYFVRNPELDLERRAAFGYEVGGLNGVGVGPPAWLEAARERSPEASVRLEDGRFVAVEHRGGTPILAGSEAAVRTPDGGFTRLLETPLSPPATGYLYVADGRLRWRTGDRPTGQAAPLPTPATVRVRRGGADYFGAVELG